VRGDRATKRSCKVRHRQRRDLIQPATIEGRTPGPRAERESPAAGSPFGDVGDRVVGREGAAWSARGGEGRGEVLTAPMRRCPRARTRSGWRRPVCAKAAAAPRPIFGSSASGSVRFEERTENPRQAGFRAISVRRWTAPARGHQPQLALENGNLERAQPEDIKGSLQRSAKRRTIIVGYVFAVKTARRSTAPTSSFQTTSVRKMWPQAPARQHDQAWARRDGHRRAGPPVADATTFLATPKDGLSSREGRPRCASDEESDKTLWTGTKTAAAAGERWVCIETIWPT